MAGWSATNLRWEGVPFEAFYRTIIEPALVPGAEITHLVFGGLDGYRSVVSIEDALADGVLIADRLDGRPLDGDHGAPVRLVSPAQYGYISTKHLCRIEVHTGEPKDAAGVPHQRSAVQISSEGEGLGRGASRLSPRLARAALLPGPQGPAALSLRPGKGFTMRIPNAVHEAHPWRIHEIAPDFTVEDVWALPAHGGADDFQTLLEVMMSLDFPSSASLPTRVLWGIRDLLGRWFGLGRISVPSTAPRMPRENCRSRVRTKPR